MVAFQPNPFLYHTTTHCNMIKRIGYLLVIALIVIQFFRPAKNQFTGPNPFTIAAHYEVPSEVDAILKKACNDCHSNNTQYPWYASIQPIAWWINDHVEEGKHHLNFDAFATYGLKKQDHKLEEVKEEVKGKKMPLPSYTRIHKDAVLSQEETEQIISWVEKTRKIIQQKMLVAGEQNTQ